MKILIIEDEIELLNAIAEGLRLNGYAVDCCNNGLVGAELVTTENYDLIILDLNLPELDGIEILKQLRKVNQETKVIILSARTQIEDKVQGLDLGANDYVTKPFHFSELEARIRSMFRRKFIQENTILSCGEISFDTKARESFVKKEILSLTTKETSLLEYFLLNQDRIISQEEFIEHIWDNSVDIFSNSIRVHISSLRKKLREKLGYDPIKTKIGEGYRLKENE